MAGELIRTYKKSIFLYKIASSQMFYSKWQTDVHFCAIVYHQRDLQGHGKNVPGGFVTLIV